MSINILCIGDPHFSDNNVEDTDLMEKAVLALVKERNPDLVICLGDLLHKHERIDHPTVFDRAMRFCMKIAKLKPFVLIVGNHDLPHPDAFLSKQHYFRPLKHCENILVADKVKQKRIGEHLLTFVPYVAVGRFVEALNTVRDSWKSSSIIFAHQEFRGCKMGSIFSQKGDEWSTEYPYVISGHIHDWQQLQANILYVGRPAQYSQKGVKTRTVSLITLSSDKKVSELRISLGLPEKKLIRVDFADLHTLPLLIQQSGNAKLKLCIRGTPDQLRIAEKSALLQEIRARGIPIEHDTLASLALPDNTGASEASGISFYNRLVSQLEAPLRELLQEVLSG